MMDDKFFQVTLLCSVVQIRNASLNTCDAFVSFVCVHSAGISLLGKALIKQAMSKFLIILAFVAIMATSAIADTQVHSDIFLDGSMLNSMRK